MQRSHYYINPKIKEQFEDLLDKINLSAFLPPHSKPKLLTKIKGGIKQ